MVRDENYGFLDYIFIVMEPATFEEEFESNLKLQAPKHFVKQ